MQYDKLYLFDNHYVYGTSISDNSYQVSIFIILKMLKM